MAGRRSLATAVSKTTEPGIDPELVRSFVTQNNDMERLVSSPVKLVETETRHTLAENSDSNESDYPARHKRKPSRLQPVGLIPVTVRLRPEIAGALKRASLERALAGDEIYTQQDIVEYALEPWLANKGYLA